MQRHLYILDFINFGFCKMNKTEKIFFLVLSVVLWLYLCLKAVFVPFVHDEVATFFYYVQSGKFLPFIAHTYTNNHFLNSALSALFYKLFGSSEFVLRLANLLSFPVFALFCYKISLHLRSVIARWSFILLLFLTNNFIEFFAISRGYGISMAFIFASVYYLICLLKTHKLKHYVFCLLSGIFAVYANLTLLPTFFIIKIIIILNLIYSLKSAGNKNIAKIFIIIIFGIFPLLFFSYYDFHLRAIGGLVNGSLNGFFDVTIKSISALLTNSSSLIFPYLFIAVFIVFTIYFFILYFRKLNLRLLLNSEIVFYVLLTGNIIASIILAKAFRVNYPEDRTGIYLFPFFIGSLTFLADSIYFKIKNKFILLIFLPFIFFTLHFFINLNLTQFAEYIEERIPKRYFSYIHRQNHKGDYPPSIGGYQMTLFCWTYMNYRSDGNSGIVNYWNYPDSVCDYQIADTNKYIPDWKKYYRQIDYDSHSELSLLQRKHFLQKSLFYHCNTSSNGNRSDEFLGFYSVPADSLINKSLFLGFKFTVRSAAVPFHSWIVVEVRNKENHSIIYTYISLNWLKLHYNGEHDNLVNEIVIKRIPQNADKVMAYFWNSDKIPYNLNGQCEIYTLN